MKWSTFAHLVFLRTAIALYMAGLLCVATGRKLGLGETILVLLLSIFIGFCWALGDAFTAEEKEDE